MLVLKQKGKDMNALHPFFRGAWARALSLGALAIVLIGLGVRAGYAQSTDPSGIPTKLVVRAVSQDAKLIQDPVGGAHITVRNAETGEVLAEGVQQGDSGSTAQIMRQPHERGADIYDTPGAAVFSTTLALTEPTRIEITAEGPLGYPRAMQSASTTLLMVPGKDVVGNGVVLTLHGFIVEVLAPQDASAAVPGDELAVQARVRMMCGCPTEPGGLWDASRYDIRAQLLKDGKIVSATPLQFAGRTSIYGATISVPAEGADQLRVVATDADRVNFGMDTMMLIE